ncbi:MAG: four helix bundle protein [Anaeroplasmataceae bacterium]|nr:four helix bundle protein [Anaeroplasmataceae bacterium]
MNDTEIIEKVDEEIKEELSESEANLPDKIKQGKGVGRKTFRITDFDAPRDKEMAVFTHAKKLSEYIFVVTEKSPIKFRWNIISRLLDTSVEIIEDLYRANYERGEERVLWQKKAMTALNLLDFYADTAKTKQAITFRQMMIIAKQISEVKKLLSGWVRSTKPKKEDVKPSDNA